MFDILLVSLYYDLLVSMIVDDKYPSIKVMIENLIYIQHLLHLMVYQEWLVYVMYSHQTQYFLFQTFPFVYFGLYNHQKYHFYHYIIHVFLYISISILFIINMFNILFFLLLWQMLLVCHLVQMLNHPLIKELLWLLFLVHLLMLHIKSFFISIWIIIITSLIIKSCLFSDGLLHISKSCGLKHLFNFLNVDVSIYIDLEDV